MSKHRREVARKMKDEKERQLEPIQRRTAVRQRAAEQEIVQAMFRPAHAKALEVAYHLLRSHSVHAQPEHHPEIRLAARSCQKTCRWHNTSAASIHNVWSTVKAAPAGCICIPIEDGVLQARTKGPAPLRDELRPDWAGAPPQPPKSKVIAFNMQMLVSSHAMQLVCQLSNSKSAQAACILDANLC